MERQTFTSRLEKFFWVFLFINPFLDIISGFFLKVISEVGVLDVETAQASITPSLVVRMVMLLIFALYVLLIRDKKAILAVLPIGAAWAFSMVSEYMFMGELSLFIDIQYMARFCYNVAVLFVYSRVFRGIGDDRDALLKKLDKLIAFTLIILTASIIISMFLGVGYDTYADRKGYRGFRGFFYAGNDITAILLLLMPISMAKFMRMDRKNLRIPEFLLYLLPAPMAANAMLIIGTKTAFLAFAAAHAGLLIYALTAHFKGRDSHLLRGFLWHIAAFAGIFGILLIFTKMEIFYGILMSLNIIGEIFEEEGADMVLLSGRQIKFREHIALFKTGGVMQWLFGMGRGSRVFILEMDIFEVFFYYGITGLFAMLWIYVKAGLDFLKRLTKRFDVVACALMISLALCAGYLIMAGHILFSVTSGFYFIFTILYSRVYFADKPDDILILPDKLNRK